MASLNAQLKTCKNDFDKLKFARDAYTVGRHPSIKDGLGFRKETKNLTSQRTLLFSTRRKGRLLWLVVLKGIMLSFIMIEDILGKLIGVMIIMLLIHMLCLPLALLLCMVEVGLGEIMLCIMCLGECVMNLPLFTMLAILLLYLHVKMQK